MSKRTPRSYGDIIPLHVSPSNRSIPPHITPPLLYHPFSAHHINQSTTRIYPSFPPFTLTTPTPPRPSPIPTGPISILVWGNINIWFIRGRNHSLVDRCSLNNPPKHFFLLDSHFPTFSRDVHPHDSTYRGQVKNN